MALATYADLRASVADYLARSDLTSQIVDHIVIFETVANRRLRVRQMETTATLTPSAGSASLPADYLAWRRVTWTGSTRVELEYLHPSLLQAYYPSTPADIPQFFTIEGSTLKVRPTDGTGLEFDYWQKITALASGANWLFTAYPDIYLFGTLAESYMMVKDFDSAQAYKARRDELFDEIDKLSRKTSGPSAVRLFGQTP